MCLVYVFVCVSECVSESVAECVSVRESEGGGDRKGALAFDNPCS